MVGRAEITIAATHRFHQQAGPATFYSGKTSRSPLAS